MRITLNIEETPEIYTYSLKYSIFTEILYWRVVSTMHAILQYERLERLSCHIQSQNGRNQSEAHIYQRERWVLRFVTRSISDITKYFALKCDRDWARRVLIFVYVSRVSQGTWTQWVRNYLVHMRSLVSLICSELCIIYAIFVEICVCMAILNRPISRPERLHIIAVVNRTQTLSCEG